MGDDKISSVLQGGINDVNVSSDGENRIYSFMVYVLNGLINLFKYLGWVMVPFLGIFVPIGIILAFKTKDQKIKLLICGLVLVLSTSILYGYSRGIQDTRYLYPLYPIFVVFSLFTIQKILEKTNKKKSIVSIIIFIILITSIGYLEIKSIDIEHERESMLIFKDVYSITNVINKFNHESGYLTLIPILEKNEPIVISNFEQNVKNIYYEKNLKLEEFIKQNYEKGLTHIVVDDGENRPDFFKKLIKNEKSFNYLEKIYDSKELGFQYDVKVFKIIMDKLE
jgi:hypothetical protein